MIVTEAYIRNNVRQVRDYESLYGADNGFLLDKDGNIIGLNLSGSNITDISALANFRRLKYLKLNDNKIGDAAPLRQTIELEKLIIYSNRISDIEFALHLTSLVFLDVRGNKIERLPFSFGDIPIPIMWEYLNDQRGIILKYNPITVPPREIVERGNREIKKYLKSVTQGDVSLNEIKIIVVGDGQAGKTSLVKTLCGDDFNEHEQATKGIARRIWRSSDHITYHFWDFGGQELMYASHAIFLTARSVYFVVIDARQGGQGEHWLNLINSINPMATVFVIITKIDTHDYDINRRDIKDKWPFVQGFIKLSCKTHEGIDKFVATLRASISGMYFPNIRISSRWLHARDEMLAMVDPIIANIECEAICKKHEIVSRDEQAAFLSCYHELGTVLSFSGFGLDNYIVIDPDWLTAAVYAIIEDVEAKQRNGLIDHDDIVRILKKLGEANIYGVSAVRFVVDLMAKYGVCFEIGTGLLLIPDLLPTQEPIWPEPMDEDPVVIIIKFQYMPPSIFHRIIVALRADILDGLLWRSGVVVSDERLGSISTVKTSMHHNELTISVSGANKSEYMAILRKIAWDSIRSASVRSQVDYIRLPSSGGHIVEINRLLERQANGQKTYYDDDSKAEFPIGTLLKSIGHFDNCDLNPDLKKQFVARDGGPYFFVSHSGDDSAFVELLENRCNSLKMRLWIDQRQLTGGQIWAVELEKKVRGCVGVLLILTENAYRSGYVQKELDWAKAYGKPIISIQCIPKPHRESWQKSEFLWHTESSHWWELPEDKNLTRLDEFLSKCWRSYALGKSQSIDQAASVDGR